MAIGNAALALWKATAETGAQATFDVARAIATGTPREVFYGEIPAQLYGLFKGQRDGFKAAWRAVKCGQTEPLPGEISALGGEGATTPFTRQRAIPNFRVAGVPVPLGSIVRAPGERMIAPIHSYFRAIGYEQSIARQAFRAAARARLEGNAFTRRIAELTIRPTREMMKTARDEASGQTLMGKGGDLTRLVMVPLNWEPKLPFLGPTKPFRFIDPFVTVASNMASEAVMERGPLGIASTRIRADLLGRNGRAVQAEAIGRMGAGIALAIVAGGLASEGLITPSAPSGDPNEARMWRLVNGMPHAVKIGDTAYDLSRLGVLGFSISVAADLWHAADLATNEDKEHVASQLVKSLTQNFMDEGFMTGPSELIEALEQPDRFGARWIQNFASAIAVPFSVGSAQVAREIDPYARQARTIMESIKAKVPWWSETLFPRRSIWGDPIPSRSWLLDYQEKFADDPVDRELMSLGVYPALPDRKIRGVELTEQQYDDYSRISGRYAKMLLDRIVSTPGFNMLPAGIRIKQIHAAISKAREQARSVVMMHALGTRNDIVAKATAAKAALLR